MVIQNREAFIMFKQIVLLTLLLSCSFLTYARTVHVYCNCPVKDVKGQSCNCPTKDSPLIGQTSFHMGGNSNLLVTLHCKQALKQHEIEPTKHSNVHPEDGVLDCRYLVEAGRQRTYYCYTGPLGPSGDVTVTRIHCKVGDHR
jgi:hypothetical protein